MATIAVQVKMSDKMKEHLEVYAEARKMTLSEIIRLAAAKETAYSLTGDDALEGRGRPVKYASDEERREARNARAREKLERQRKIMDAVMRAERLDSVEALERYLRARGISLDSDQEEHEQVAV